MVNEEILGGLKSALERGSTLEKAMLTLFNSGYKRKDIEEAAAALLESNRNAQVQEVSKDKSKKGKAKPVPPASQPAQQVQAPPAPRIQPILASPSRLEYPKELYSPKQKPAPTLVQKPVLTQQQMQAQMPVQRVSNYEKSGNKETSKEKGKIFLLVFLLILLIGLFAAIFVFRQQFIDFLNAFFA